MRSRHVGTAVKKKGATVVIQQSITEAKAMSNTVQTLPAVTTATSSKISQPAEVSNAAHVAKRSVILRNGIQSDTADDREMRRLQSELMALMMSDTPGFSAFPTDESDLTHWTGRLEGPEGTFYEGQTYAISLSFPSTYPYSAPTVKFESPCFRQSLFSPTIH